MRSLQGFTDRADIVVCGAGTAGTFAALAAARMGKKVIVVEQFGAPGGSATMGLVTPLMSVALPPDDPQCSALAIEVEQRLVAEADHYQGSSFDSNMLMMVLDEMLQLEENITMYYHTTLTGARVENGTLQAVLVSNKAGPGVIEADVFIDATGDADLSFYAGAELLQGDETHHINQPSSLRYTITGVDVARLHALVVEKDELLFRTHRDTYGRKVMRNQMGDGYTPGKEFFATAVTAGQDWPLKDIFEQAIANGDLEKEDLAYWQVFDVPNQPNTLTFNNPEFFNLPDILSPLGFSKAQQQGRRAIWRQLKFYRKYLPGFEHAALSQIAPMVGVRESCRAVTDHVLTYGELCAHRKFDDAVCCNNYAVDIHGGKHPVRAVEGGDVGPVDPDPWYDIPYRSLIVKGLNNLLVTGRCTGSDFISQSSLRVQPPVRALGEAAGTAAAMALLQGKTIRQVQGRDVRLHMIAQGAQFPQGQRNYQA